MSGMRDIALENTDNNSLVHELLWDIIYLTEYQYMLDYYKGEHHKDFQKALVKRVGSHLNDMVNPTKTKIRQNCIRPQLWRAVGERYTLLYLPLHFKDLIWCKATGSFLHVVLPGNREKNEIHVHKEWLLAILEMAGFWSLSHVRLYIPRTDLTNIQALLKNLHWIGANLVPNEDRNECQNDDDSDIMLSDENYIILECEC